MSRTTQESAAHQPSRRRQGVCPGVHINQWFVTTIIHYLRGFDLRAGRLSHVHAPGDLPGSGRRPPLPVPDHPPARPLQCADLARPRLAIPTQVIPALIHIRQVEAPTRPLAHVGADPPGVGIISKLRAHAAAGTHYMPAAGFANDVRAMCNRILGLWIYFPAAEEAEFDAYHTYSVPNYMDN